MGTLRTVLEYRQLAYFIQACQHQSLGDAAAELGVAQSTLSSSLKKLEADVGLPLFKKVVGRLHPTNSALWFCRKILPVLHMEEFITHFFTSGWTRSPNWILINAPLRFMAGHLNKSISRAIQENLVKHPETLLLPYLFDLQTEGLSSESMATHTKVPEPVCQINLFYRDGHIDNTGLHQLLEDPWIIVSTETSLSMKQTKDRYLSLEELKKLPLTIPNLTEVLVRQAAHYCQQYGINSVQWTKDTPESLPSLIDDEQQFFMLMPNSLMTTRFAGLPIQTWLLEKPLVSTFCAQLTKDLPVARDFIDLLRIQINKKETNVIFKPKVTLRQLRYFNTLHLSRSLTAASQKLHVVQPALTTQLKNLEDTLRYKLFERLPKGLKITPAGRRLSELTNRMLGLLDDIEIQHSTFTADKMRSLRIGVIPSADQHSFLLKGLTKALNSWHQQFPDFHLEIIEAPYLELIKGVSHHQLHLAVVDVNTPNICWEPLHKPEILAVIASPTSDILSTGPIRFSQLSELELILPLKSGGIRQLLDRAAANIGKKLQPKLECNALILSQEMVMTQKLATVLPVSAVKNQIVTGQLIYSEIIEPVLTRQLGLAYMPERKLSDPELALLDSLRAAFINH